MEFQVSRTTIRIIEGDITDQEVDAIVNAANCSLMGGGGVDGAIHRKGGLQILNECKKIRQTEWPEGLPTGRAVATSGGDLKAKYVIHTVGPVWRGGRHREPELLAEAYVSSLKLAVSKGLKTIAFPSISTGAYNYPVREAAEVSLRTIKNFLEKNEGTKEIIFVLFTQSALEVFRTVADEVFGWK